MGADEVWVPIPPCDHVVSHFAGIRNGSCEAEIAYLTGNGTDRKESIERGVHLHFAVPINEDVVRFLFKMSGLVGHKKEYDARTRSR